MGLLMTAWSRKLLGLGSPPVSRDRALDIARHYCDTQGYEWVEPVAVVERLRYYLIHTNAEKRGGNVWLRIDNGSGEVLSATLARR
jgi:hypothetical protein